MILAPKITSAPSDAHDRMSHPAIAEPKTNGLRWILSINTALWGLIIAGCWMFT